MMANEGALWEALTKLKEELDHLAGAEYIINRTVALLSLSNPIEPASRDEMKAQWEIYRKERWPDREEAWSNHWSDIAIDFALALARPTQASSEIREALEDLLINEVCSCRKYLDGKPCPRCKVAIDNARELVYSAPSRQGAGKP